ncbi:hypothetical protein CCR75_002694 [Bremia lactucae]|uniref:Uncharacterized protein n=1 Tax=Bremia lactucae TaxID=4779 RepID=A0A976IGN9_BRELC|nr:hypothetical protein CCR75_002694 [Bremia lactucae]
MAIAPTQCRKVIMDAEVPKHKVLARIRSRCHRHKSATPKRVHSASSPHRETRSDELYHVSQQKPQLGHCRYDQPHKPARPVYDCCITEVMMLKAQLHRGNSRFRKRFHRFVMKRMIVPPVTIPKAIAEQRGSKQFVGGQRVPFTRGMWESEKLRQYRRLHTLPVLHEV